jgi:exopolysaccharide biosynthesis polyprenyl glycosylphosphotransferase
MKKSELIFNIASIFVDFIMIMAAGIAAFYLRFQLTEFRPIIYNLTAANYLAILFLIAPTIVVIFALAGLYNLKGTRKMSREIGKIILTVSFALLGIVVLFFFNQTIFPSRLIILMTWAGTIVLVSLGRMILRAIQITLLKKGIGLHRLVIIDSPDTNDENIFNEILKRPELGYKIIKLLKFNYRSGQLINDDLEKLINELEQIRKDQGLDEILQSNLHLPYEVNIRILSFCHDYGILFNFVPNYFETARRNIAVETIGGTPIINLKSTPLSGWGKVVKRVVDIIVSAIALIILSPILLIVAIVIKLESKGPVLFHQLRAAGLGAFEFYKFRTMYFEMSEGTPQGDKLRKDLEKNNARVGPYVKIKNDPRVTRFGRILRKTKLDEMPQLWHILRGQMSLVGPRIHMVKEVDHFRNDYKRLFIIKPGATGLTQIIQATEKPEISWQEEIQLDAFYIENWSIWLDLTIIFKTILVLLGRKPKADY